MSASLLSVKGGICRRLPCGFLARGVVHGLVAAAFVCAAGTAEAQRRGRTILSSAAGGAIASRPEPMPAPVAAPDIAAPLIAVVSIADQRIAIHGRDGVVARAPVSTGMAGHRTPTGIFSVLQKSRWHTSNLYSDAPMPYMQRLTWSGIALHAGRLPGYPASHGCIRLPESFAADLWGMTRLGVRVVVSPSPTNAEGISGDLLPEAALRPVPELPPDPNDPASHTTGPDASGESRAAASAVVTRISYLPSGAAERPLLAPHAWAAHARRNAEVHARNLARRARDLLERSADISAEAVEAREMLAVARTTRQHAEAQFVAAREALAAAIAAERPEELIAEARVRRARTADEAGRLAAESDEIARLEANINDLAFTAARLAREAEEAAAAAADEVRSLGRRAEPVSVLVSRKDGRAYLRQGGETILDVPIAMQDAARPLGTHLLVAMEPVSGAAGATSLGLRWKAVTVPSSADGGRIGAADALQRIEWPEAIRRELSERLWVNGAIMLTDEGISSETGKGTDFIVLTR